MKTAPMLLSRGATLMWFTLSLLTFGAAGCELLEERYPTEPEAQYLVVHGMLVADQPEQHLLVEYTRPIDRGYFRGLTPASGSVVSLVRDGASYPMVEDLAQPGLYRASFTPRAGERYTLRVEGPGGEIATSETMIPGTPQLTVPSRDTVVEQGRDFGIRFPVHWTHATPRAGYIIARRDPDEDSPTFLLRDLRYYPRQVLQDTAAIETVAGLSDNQAGARFNIVAVDANYFSYVREDSADGSPPASLSRGVIDGGFGLFASIAYSNTRKVLVAP